jgi:serine/threonine protein kinase
MELVHGVSLLSYLKAQPGRKIDENVCKHVFSQIISGILYLHCQNIYHRDIKLENIIIDEKNNVKIIDFGFGTISQSTKLLNFFCGTPSYMPPEIVKKKDYIGSSADIWSIGILLYTLVCGSFPFRGKNIYKRLAITEKELYSKISKGVYIVPETISNEVKSLIQKILIVNPINRIDAQTVIVYNFRL